MPPHDVLLITGMTQPIYRRRVVHPFFGGEKLRKSAGVLFFAREI